MNELSQKMLSELANLGNFFKNKDKQGKVCIEDPINMKLFFLFQNTGNESIVSKKKKKKKGTSSNHSKYSSDISKNEKMEFSLKDLAAMPVSELASKVFTFEKKLT